GRSGSSRQSGDRRRPDAVARIAVHSGGPRTSVGNGAGARGTCPGPIGSCRRYRPGSSRSGAHGRPLPAAGRLLTGGAKPKPSLDPFRRAPTAWFSREGAGQRQDISSRRSLISKRDSSLLVVVLVY